MSTAHSHDPTVPRPALIAAAALVALTLALTILVRAGLMPREAVPAVARAQAHATVLDSRLLTFADRSDGAVVIAEAGSGRTVGEIHETTPSGGFVRGVLRGLARVRRTHGIGAAPPFELTRWSDGSLSLRDTATGRSVELGAFGPDNRAVFAALLGDRKG